MSANDKGERRAETEDDLLTVIVPCLDEEQLVESTAAEILGVADQLPLETNVLFVDDGSSDGTRFQMQAICDRDPRCRMVVNHRNLGLGRSVLNSYSDLPPDSWVTVIPGDSEFVFSSIWNFLEVRQQYDLILGYLQNPVIRTSMRRLASFAFKKTVQVLYGYPYRYLNGMKMYRAKVFAGIEVLSSGHAFNAELLAKALLRNPCLRIGEVPFVERGRSLGASKAFSPGAIVRAVREVVVGYRSVAIYREREIQRHSH